MPYKARFTIMYGHCSIATGSHTFFIGLDADAGIEK